MQHGIPLEQMQGSKRPLQASWRESCRGPRSSRSLSSFQQQRRPASIAESAARHTARHTPKLTTGACARDRRKTSLELVHHSLRHWALPKEVRPDDPSCQAAALGPPHIAAAGTRCTVKRHQTSLAAVVELCCCAALATTLAG